MLAWGGVTRQLNAFIFFFLSSFSSVHTLQHGCVCVHTQNDRKIFFFLKKKRGFAMMRFSNVMSTRWRLPCRPPVSIDELPDHFGYLASFFFFFSFGTSIGFIVYTGRPFFFFLLFTRIRSFPLYQGQQQKKSSDDLRTSSESLPSIDGSLFDIGTRICKTR